MRLPRLYPIIDTIACAARGWRVTDLARAYVAGGATLLQIRGKDLSSGALSDLCREVIGEIAGSGVKVIVNDRADVAMMVGADGVHVGQDDLRPKYARTIVGAEGLVGLSTHRLAEIDLARHEPISYIAVGPIFVTSTKTEAHPVVGLDLVRYAAAAQSRPVVAIGGITLETARSTIDAGAASVAVISDLLSSGDPEARVRAFIERLGEAGKV